MKTIAQEVARVCRQKEGESGFTLVELLVVMLIILILLAIAIPTFLGIISNARNTIPVSDLGESIVAAAAIYTQDQGEFGSPDSTHAFTELQSAEPGVQFTTSTLTTATANVQDLVQIDACGNVANVSCQWIAMAAISQIVGACYYVLINKGNSTTGLAWSNPSSTPALISTSIKSGIWYATIGPISPNFSQKMTSCNVFTDSPQDVQGNGFPPA